MSSSSAAGAGFQVPYELRDAEFGGQGLYAVSHIPQGTLVWKFVAGDNVVEYDEAAATRHLSTLSMADAKVFLDLTYGIGDKLCYITDDGRYMNHSTQPNCITDMATGHTYALRDIAPNEQLFEDYARFEHPVFLFPLLERYQCAPSYYQIPPDEIPEGHEKIQAFLSANDNFHTSKGGGNDDAHVVRGGDDQLPRS
jgi:hypothetical protein